MVVSKLAVADFVPRLRLYDGLVRSGERLYFLVRCVILTFIASVYQVGMLQLLPWCPAQG